MIYALVIVGIFLLFSFYFFACKNKKPFKRAFISILLGPLTLVIVDLISSLTSVYVPLSPLSVMTTFVGGIPSVALLVMMQIIV